MLPTVHRSSILPVAVFGVLIGALLLAGMATFNRLQAMAVAAERVDHSHRVLRALDRSVMYLADAESGLRGYAVTSDRSFRELIDAASPRAERRSAELVQLLRDEPGRAEQAARLHSLLVERLAVIGQNAELVGQREFEDALTPVRSGENTALMAEIRGLSERIRVDEEAELNSLDQRGRAAKATGRAVLSATLVLALGLGFLAVLNAVDAARRARRVEAETAQRAAAEDKVGAREREMVALANSMPQLVWAADASGKYDYFNQRWYEYTGMADEADAEEWEEYIHAEDHAHTMKVWTCCLENGEPYQVEYRLRQADGTYRWFMGRAVPLRAPDGRIVRWFGTSTDVDEERRLSAEREAILESERAARSEAERASRLKDDFVATVSHELRTPLNAVLGWVGILRRDPAPDARTQGLEVIERNARTQARLVDDLLDTSRAMAGKLRLEIQSVNFASVVEAAIETIRPAAIAKGVALETSIEPVPLAMAADPNRIQQVAWNLISNAIKFTPGGGSVNVELKSIGSTLRLTVRDTGEGMAADFVPHVFERFRQADASTTRRHGGLGLGLAIARHLVELHGGTIRASSRGEGLGSTFIVELPLSAYVPSTVRRLDGMDQHGLPSLVGADVLIVDDDPDGRELVARLLEECGAKTRVAASVEAAMALYLIAAPSVLISDIGMPEQDGVDLIRKIREIETPMRRFTPAVALSALARPEDRDRALAAGFDLHVAKPVEPDELAVVVARLVRLAPKHANGILTSSLERQGE